MKAIFYLICIFLSQDLWLSDAAYAQENSQPLRVGSKSFTENIILGEIINQYMQALGLNSLHRAELGGTRILWSALLKGDIDVYVDYTGTLTHEIFAEKSIRTFEGLRAALAELNLGVSPPLGFNNTYAFGMMRATAEAKSITKISDLLRHPELRFGFGNEFMRRKEGWPGVREHYKLPQTSTRGLQHDLAYKALSQNHIDLMDIYTTDAEIKFYDLTVLEDDLAFFPRYEAVVIYRLDRLEGDASFQEILETLAGEITEEKMIAMNEKAKLGKQRAAIVAHAFLKEQLGLDLVDPNSRQGIDLLIRTQEHMLLVGISMFFAILIGVPLGILAAKFYFVDGLILQTVGLIQTIPSLAILVFMIPLLGIGAVPAMAALFLYSLLPIVRNTYQGFREIPEAVNESAIVLGLPFLYRLRVVELPLAMGNIIGGIKTSAVINVGTATLGALIGAGGYGQPILTGIRLDDMNLILSGAVPAAVLALVTQAFFSLAEQRLRIQ
jgi:osmoprotectant transport system permease protein